MKTPSTHLSPSDLWQRYKTHTRHYPDLGLSLDISRMPFPEDFFPSMEKPMQEAFTAMQALEKGEMANPDEQRMVGHYWLRTPSLAPTQEITRQIEDTLQDILSFARDVHAGTLQGQGGAFSHLLVIGIGGSALGPQFVAQALGQPRQDRLRPWFFDNTDPDGMDRVLSALDGQLGQTLCLVISKSGSTKETRNGMLEAKWAFERAKLDFSRHAVAITGDGSQLHREAEGWLRRFPMWDWVGGRTSETSAVGLLPAALQGFDIQNLLEGCRQCDAITRQPITRENPAALLALMWHFIGNGKGEKSMVVLPYKDRLELFSRYLQQLIMESLGKEIDRHGKVVHQGLTVYGNKGSTDQHAYVQQLRDGLPNFFVNFIEVLHDRQALSPEVEDQVTSGDYLFGFLQGTRQALYENQRPSITMTLDTVSPFHIGVLIALFERAVGLYASLIHINAYHQPGVEAGKKAAGHIIHLQTQVLAFLQNQGDQAWTADQIAAALSQEEKAEAIFAIARHLAANQRGIHMDATTPLHDSTFRAKA